MGAVKLKPDFVFPLMLKLEKAIRGDLVYNGDGNGQSKMWAQLQE